MNGCQQVSGRPAWNGFNSQNLSRREKTTYSCETSFIGSTNESTGLKSPSQSNVRDKLCCKMQRCHPSPWTEITPPLELAILVCSLYQHKPLSLCSILTEVPQEMFDLPHLFPTVKWTLWLTKARLTHNRISVTYKNSFPFSRHMCPVRPF